MNEIKVTKLSYNLSRSAPTSAPITVAFSGQVPAHKTDGRDAHFTEVFGKLFQETFHTVEARMASLKDGTVEHLRQAFSAGIAVDEQTNICDACESYLCELGQQLAPEEEEQTAQALTLLVQARTFWQAGAKAAIRYSLQHQQSQSQ